MESDFRWRYHLDYRDVPWRSRAALIRHLPPDSAVANIGTDRPHFSVEAHLLDDVRMLLMLLCGFDKRDVKPHQHRPKGTKRPDPERLKKMRDARKRARERKRKIEAGEIK